MDAMILAAGLGTRLRPLTDHTPKVLVEVGGVPILERIARRLVAAGADRIIVNAHHHADQIEAQAARLAGDLGVEVLVSVEVEKPQETGGGLAHAEPLFRKDGPFFLHNGDIVTDIDLADMLDAHRRTRALATLAVGRRETTRYLLFDDRGLCGWENVATGESERCRKSGRKAEAWPFAGIHAISPEIFGLITEAGVFSIINLYLRLSTGGHAILPHDVTGAPWLEIGDPERLARARAILGGSL
ncbi:MAG: sugar phosphate nucleotidyltransferase [Gemmatimonadota bacterium]